MRKRGMRAKPKHCKHSRARTPRSDAQLSRRPRPKGNGVHRTTQNFSTTALYAQREAQSTCRQTAELVELQAWRRAEPAESEAR